MACTLFKEKKPKLLVAISNIQHGKTHRQSHPCDLVLCSFFADYDTVVASLKTEFNSFRGMEQVTRYLNRCFGFPSPCNTSSQRHSSPRATYLIFRPWRHPQSDLLAFYARILQHWSHTRRSAQRGFRRTHNRSVLQHQQESCSVDELSLFRKEFAKATCYRVFRNYYS